MAKSRWRCQMEVHSANHIKYWIQSRDRCSCITHKWQSRRHSDTPSFLPWLPLYHHITRFEYILFSFRPVTLLKNIYLQGPTRSSTLLQLTSRQIHQTPTARLYTTVFKMEAYFPVVTKIKLNGKPSSTPPASVMTPKGSGFKAPNFVQPSQTFQ